MALDGATSEELDAVLSVLDDMLQTDSQAQFQPLNAAQSEADGAVDCSSETSKTGKPSKSMHSKKTKPARACSGRKHGRAESFDPNRARRERAVELRELRSSVQELTEKLAALQSVAAEGGGKLALAPRTQAKSGKGESAVWEDVFHSQFAQLLEAATENARLKRALEETRRIAEGLQEAAVKSSRAMSHRGIGSSLSARVHRMLLDPEGDSKMFEMMFKEVDASYDEAPEVFRLNGLSHTTDTGEARFGVQMHEGEHGRIMDMFSESILPFPVEDTSRVVWEFYSGLAKHRGPVCFKTTKTINSSHETVIEKFIMEQRALSMRRDFRVWQVLRRYVEGDRTLVVWIGIVLPAEISHKPRASVGYRQKGYVLCERFGSFTHLRRCHRVTPYLSTGPKRNLTEHEKREISSIIEWNLDLNTIRSHLEHFENRLLDESLQRQTQVM